MPPGGIILSRTRRANADQGSNGPEPTWAEDFSANARLFLDDMPSVQRKRRNAAYADIVERLRERKVPEADEWFTLTNEATLLPVFGHWQDYWDTAKVWQVVQRDRQAAIQRGEKDPYADLPSTREEFERQIETRERAVERGLVSTGGSTRRQDQATVARSSRMAPGLVAGLTTSFVDELNLATLPIGGASKTVAQAAIRNAIINVGIEAVQMPGVAMQRERMGETLTIDEGLLRLGSAAGFGAFLGGGSKILADNWGSIKGAPAAVQERVWASILDRNPGLREKVGSTIDWDALDPHLTDIAERIIPPERMTDAERGAINALRRDAATQSGNPFVPDGAGTEAHYKLLGETLQGIINDSPAYVPKTRPPASARLRGSTSISTAVTGDAFATVKARIGVVESGGSATARNPRSSAMGLYQFTDKTWLAYYKARFGSQGLSDAAIIAKKGDTGLQNTLMDDLMADNAKALQDAGFAVDPGNLYLAHFAGRQGAADLLRADPSAPAWSVLGNGKAKGNIVIDANPFLRDMTAGEVIAWAHGKMGGKAPPVAARGEAGAPSDVMGAIDRELADTQAELARLDSEIEAAARPASDVIEDLTPDAVRVVDEPPMPRIEAPDGTRAPIGTDGRAEVAGMTPEARSAIPMLKGIVERELDLSLNDTAALSARVGVDERNLRMALQQMAIDGLVIQKRNGNFARLPRPKDGPMDVLAYVASTGGVTPKGFSQSLMAIHENMANPPKGHDLGRIFAVEREVRWKRKPDKARGIEGIPLAEPYRTTRPALIPGYGPIVRSTGRGLEEIGEDLWSAGYFGPPESRPRPTETEVINLLQDAFGSGKKVYSIYDQQRAADLEAEAAASGYADPKNPFASDFQSEEHFIFEWNNFDRTADEVFGITLDQEAFIAAWGEYRTAGDGDVRGAVVRAVQREIEDVQAREIAERGIDDAEDIIAEWEEVIRRDGFIGGEEGARPYPEPGDPGPDAQAGWSPVRWEETGPLDPERWQHWDEPDGPAAKIDADSMEHDLRVQDERRRARRKDRPRDEARAAEQDARMRLALEQMAAERKARMSDEEFMQRGDRKVATIAPILYRETSVENLFPYLPESGVVIGRGPAGAVHYTATTPDLALGQGSNRGVMIEIDAGEMTGRIDFSKPGAEVLAQTQRQAEVIVSAQDYELGRNIRSFTVRPDAEIKKVDRFRFNRVMRDLEAKGWTRSEGPDGVTMTRPGTGAAPAEPAPTITTAADGQADFAAPTGAQVRTALERQTEGGIRPTGEQKAPGSDGGLFDTRAPEADLFDGVGFRLDEEGDVINPADLLAEFDEEAAFIRSMRDCL